MERYSFTIRGTAEGVYADRVGMVGCYNGIDFRGCDNFMVQDVTGCFYNRGLMCGNSSSGFVYNFLSNGAAVARLGLSSLFPSEFTGWPSDSNMESTLYSITRNNLVLIDSDGVQNLTVVQAFSFALNCLASLKNGNAELYNVAADSLNNSGYMVYALNSRVFSVNSMRYGGESFASENSQVTMLNRMSIPKAWFSAKGTYTSSPEYNEGDVIGNAVFSNYAYRQYTEPEITPPLPPLSSGNTEGGNGSCGGCGSAVSLAPSLLACLFLFIKAFFWRRK